MFPWLSWQKLSDWYKEMSAESKSLKKEKNNLIIPSRERSAATWDLRNVRWICTTLGVPSQTWAGYMCLSSPPGLIFFFICLWNLWVSDKLHAARQHLQLISGLLFCLHSERTQFIAADTIWRLHQADSSHAVILFSSTGDRFAHSHRQWKM